MTLSTSLSLQLGLRICPSAPAASPGEVALVEEIEDEGEAAEAATSVAVAVATVVAPVEKGEEETVEEEEEIELLPLFDWDCNK